MARDLALRPHGVWLGTVFARTLREQRRALLWWTLGVVGTVLMYAAIWPTIRQNAVDLNRYLDSFPDAMRNLIGSADFGTPDGYLQSELFSFVAPIVFLVYAIGAGARAIAGEEEAGSLDVLLSTPIRRRRVLVDTFGSMTLALLGLAFLLWASTLLLGRGFDMRADLAHLSAAALSTFLVALVFGSLSLAVGCLTGSRSTAIGVSSGLAVVTFLLNMFGPSVPALDRVRWISPFFYYGGAEPMLHGLDPVHPVVLVGISLAA
ncbi:MAG TPA: ABC transporter permease subunit, partial [Actinomycetota bacterium]|nr:ABC transporter permease subunit [Actinomycetota bacterium]